MASENNISVIDAAAEIGIKKQTAFKILKRLGIRPALQRTRTTASRGQKIAYITPEEYAALKEHADNRSAAALPETVAGASASGFFYVIQLEPEHDPARIKLGFASNIEERLRSHKTAAPFSVLVRAWPCKLLWEKTAIDCVAAGEERLHTEVFRTANLDSLLARADSFFALMPDLEESK